MPRKIEPIEGSETSAFKPQTPGKYPKENILHNTYVTLMYELKKKIERYLRVNLLGPGPRLMKKVFTGSRSHKG